MQNPNQRELAKRVHVVANVTIRWDGKEYDLSEGCELEYGIVEYWEKRLGTEFQKEEVKEKPIPDREIKSPLEEVGRGESFSALKTRKPRGQ